MAYFTDEDQVREVTQLKSSERVPSSAVQRAIKDAHAALLERLQPQYNSDPPPEEVARAETMLAGGRLLRYLAAGRSLDAEELMLQGKRVGRERVYAALVEMSRRLEEEGWEIAAPYLEVRECGDFAAGASDASALWEDEVE